MGAAQLRAGAGRINRGPMLEDAGDNVHGRINVAGGRMPRATEVEWFEKDMGGVVAEWMLDLVDHQPIAVDTQPFQGDGPSGNVTTNAL